MSKWQLPVLVALVVLSAGCLNLQSPSSTALEERITYLERKVDILNSKLELLQKTNLSGDIYGPLNGTKISENTITSSHIVDGTISKNDVNPSEIQLRVSSACPAGYYMVGIMENGSVMCRLYNASGGSLSDVLKNGNGAGGQNITGLYAIETERVDANEICLDSQCASDWPQIENYTLTKVVGQFAVNPPSPSQPYRTLVMSTTFEWDLCALSMEQPFSDGGYCKIYAHNGIWHLQTYKAHCEAYCITYRLERDNTSSS